MAESSTIVFRALQLVNEQRNAYGMRHNDFVRYRKHCGSRTHRLRSNLKMTHGKGRDFKQLPPITVDIIKSGHLELLLLETERAWVYSQDLIAQASQSAKEDRASTLRRSATGRFRRAVNWSKQLLYHCQSLYNASRLSAENLLEATIYTIIMNGRFLRRRDDFEDALPQLCVAKSLLEELIAVAPSSRDQALAILFSDDINPEIRYCAHELHRSKAYDVDATVAEFAPQNKNKIVEGCDSILKKLNSEGLGKSAREWKKLKPITWEGELVPIRNPELVDVFLKIQETESRLGRQEISDAAAVTHKKENRSTKKGVAAYNAILSALSDAEEVSRMLVEAQQLSGNANTVVPGKRDIHFVHAFIVFQLLSCRIQRDFLLISALLASQPGSRVGSRSLLVPLLANNALHPEEVDTRLYPAVVKLLDTVMQSIDQMRTLSIVDDSPDLASAIDARLSFTKARRCLYLARCYAPLKKYAEALTVLQHATIHVRETYTALSGNISDPVSQTVQCFYPLNSTDMKEIDAGLASDGLRFKRDWFAYNGGSTTTDPKLYKKPLFFNIALNYVELDVDRLLKRAAMSKPLVFAADTSPLPVVAEKKMVSKAQEDVRSATPEPQASSVRSGLSSLLGGWWGK